VAYDGGFGVYVSITLVSFISAAAKLGNQWNNKYKNVVFANCFCRLVLI